MNCCSSILPFIDPLVSNAWAVLGLKEDASAELSSNNPANNGVATRAAAPILPPLVPNTFFNPWPIPLPAVFKPDKVLLPAFLPTVATLSPTLDPTLAALFFKELSLFLNLLVLLDLFSFSGVSVFCDLSLRLFCCASYARISFLCFFLHFLRSLLVLRALYSSLSNGLVRSFVFPWSTPGSFLLASSSIFWFSLSFW